jgi:hypothetical protein
MQTLRKAVCQDMEDRFSSETIEISFGYLADALPYCITVESTNASCPRCFSQHAGNRIILCEVIFHEDLTLSLTVLNDKLQVARHAKRSRGKQSKYDLTDPEAYQDLCSILSDIVKSWDGCSKRCSVVCNTANDH